MSFNLVGAAYRGARQLIAPLACGFAVAMAGLAVSLAAPSHAQAPASDPIEALQNALDSGQAKLSFVDDGHGYLISLLDALHIPRDSQLLVFSASSLQFEHINQATPRALYYNDDVAVGTVQNGRLFELITTDSTGALAFYTLDVAKADRPKFEKQGGECIICHGFATRWAAGWMVNNTDTGPKGALLGLSPGQIFRLTDDRTPFDQRYGGWYVTGDVGTMAHRGNITLDPATFAPFPGQPRIVTSLADRIDLARYLEPDSDIVSLLTLEHQTGFINLVAKINAQYRGLNNPSLPAGLQATPGDIDASIEEMVAYMTFSDEEPLPSPVKGQSSFSRTFPARGPDDAKGRSLRQFDLNRRIFRYPLSYMVYSPAFAALNPAAKDRVMRRLYDVLSGADRSGAYATLTARGGPAAINILAATKPGLPAYWKPVTET